MTIDSHCSEVKNTLKIIDFLQTEDSYLILIFFIYMRFAFRREIAFFRIIPNASGHPAFPNSFPASLANSCIAFRRPYIYPSPSNLITLSSTVSKRFLILFCLYYGPYKKYITSISSLRYHIIVISMYTTFFNLILVIINRTSYLILKRFHRPSKPQLFIIIFHLLFLL